VIETFVLPVSAVGVELSVIFTVNGNVPVVVGVPEILVGLVNVSPPGRVPVTVNV
jgi:hypothetical protein